MPALLDLAPRAASRRVEPREWARRDVLDSVRSQQREIDAGEARKLTLATDWADLHRADAVAEQTDESGVFHAESIFAFATEPVVMSGVPVDDHCLAELATALKLSHGATRSYVEDGLEIRERLPRLWGKVRAGKCKVGKARAVAQRTRFLSDEAADFVDRQLAPFAGSLSLTRIKTAVDAAILKFDPARAAAEAADASDGRGVWTDLEHGGTDLVLDGSRPNGVGRAEIVGSIPDLMAFEAAIDDIAGDLKFFGDESSEQVRRSKAVGIVADSQYRLDLAASADVAREEEAALVEVRGASRASKPSARRRPNRVRTPLGIERPIHIHLHTSTEVARVQASGLPHAASPVAQAAIERWIADLAPGAKVKVTPVVDLNRHYAVDAYEAPDHIRALVEARDHVCVFPFCTNRGRYDLDHVNPYRDPDDPDDPGPPGQTSNHNIAKLCRYHHRVKTHGGWTYTRIGHPDDLHDAGHDDGDRILDTDPPTLISAQDRGGPPAAYRWTSPMGHPYLVTGTGTYPLD